MTKTQVLNELKKMNKSNLWWKALFDIAFCDYIDDLIFMGEIK
jgi:hypothetical protein